MINLVGKDRTFTAYQKRGYEFNILMALDKNVRPWLLTKYCNCSYVKGKRAKFDFVIDGGEWFANEDVFNIDIIRVKKNLDLCFQNNLFNIIINRLEKGAYVYGYFDEFYIKNKRAYHNYHFKHSFFIYGYECFEKVFYALGYTNNGRFDEYTIAYEDFMCALTGLDNIELTFVCINPMCLFNVKPESFYYGLYDYVHSTRSTRTYDASVVYGISTLYEFANYVKEVADNRVDLDLRYSKFYMEFNSFMFERLEYLYKNCYIGNICAEYSNICKVFQSIHMLFIKYNLTYDTEIIKRICRMIEEAANKERIILSQVLSELKQALMERNNQSYI